MPAHHFNRCEVRPETFDPNPDVFAKRRHPHSLLGQNGAAFPVELDDAKVVDRDRAARGRPCCQIRCMINLARPLSFRFGYGFCRAATRQQPWRAQRAKQLTASDDFWNCSRPVFENPLKFHRKNVSRNLAPNPGVSMGNVTPENGRFGPEKAGCNLPHAQKPNVSVAQIFNLLCRRIVFGGRWQSRCACDSVSSGGLQIRDTAECDSALRHICLPSKSLREQKLLCFFLQS